MDQNDGWNLHVFFGTMFLFHKYIYYIYISLDDLPFKRKHLHVKDEVAFFKSVINMYPSM